MPNLVSMQKLEIVIEGLELPRVLAAVERAGACGYTVVPRVTGKGGRGEREVQVLEGHPPAER